jgi:hypothetical protein
VKCDEGGIVVVAIEMMMMIRAAIGRRVGHSG